MSMVATAEWVSHLLGEWFEEPCNYSLGDIDVAEYMTDHCQKYCDENCDNHDHGLCWLRFFEALKGEENNGHSIAANNR